MARRPAPPRRAATPPRRPAAPRSAESPAPPARSPRTPAEPAPAPGSPRSYGRSNPAPTPISRPHRTEEPQRGGSRVVHAADRFRGLVSPRPWRRRRRALIAGAVVTVLLLLGALSAAIWLPALRLQEVSVTGLGYVPEQEVREVIDPHLGSSVLLLPTDTISEELTAIPGVAQAQVERRWPRGVEVSVTEAQPVAQLTRADGTTAVVDAVGTELPAAAAEGAELVPLTVAATAQDPDGTAEALSEVLAEIPEPLRSGVQDMTASSPSDVTLTLSLEEAGTKTVVWGDARDSELKATVVQALLPEPGTVIDVSSPVAPVTR